MKLIASIFFVALLAVCSFAQGGYGPGPGTSHTVAAGFNCTDVAGCWFWGKANSLALSNSDPVGTWADQSGNSNDLTQSTSGSKPLYKTNVLNSLPVVRFDGIDDNMTSPLSNGSPCQLNGANVNCTMFIVVKATGSTPEDLIDAGTLNQSVLQHSGASSVLAYAGGVLSASATPGDFTVYYVVWGAGDPGSVLGVNGVETTGNAGGANLYNTGGVTVGSGGGGSFPAACDIAEVIIYNTALGTTDRGTVYTYLKTKYGL